MEPLVTNRTIKHWSACEAKAPNNLSRPSTNKSMNAPISQPLMAWLSSRLSDQILLKCAAVVTIGVLTHMNWIQSITMLLSLLHFALYAARPVHNFWPQYYRLTPWVYRVLISFNGAPRIMFFEGAQTNLLGGVQGPALRPLVGSRGEAPVGVALRFLAFWGWKIKPLYAWI